MPETQPLNATQGSLLGFLQEGPKTGWDLLQEAAYGLARFWNVTASHLYRELKVLEERGLIEAGERGRSVPEILLSGNHPAIAEWREQQSKLRSEQTKKQ